jgi:hypothetical protein
VRTVSSWKWPIAVARIGRLDGKQTSHHGAAGASLARRRARMTPAMDDLLARVRPLVVLLAVLGVAHAAVASPTKYLVKVRSDKRIDFSKIRTYTWMEGWPAFDPSIDWQIETDVDRELAALGVTKVTAEPCDTVVTYAAIRRTDVDVKTKVSPDSDLRREYPAGTVIVLMLDPHSRRELFRGRADMALQSDPAQRRQQIRSAIAQMFSRYPTRRR